MSSEEWGGRVRGVGLMGYILLYSCFYTLLYSSVVMMDAEGNMS